MCLVIWPLNKCEGGVDLVIIQSSVLTQKYPCISNASVNSSSAHPLPRANRNGILLKYVIFKTYKTLGDRYFMVAAPNLWNNLPLEVRRVPNIDNFKKLLKTFLFKKAFLNI